MEEKSKITVNWGKFAVEAATELIDFVSSCAKSGCNWRKVIVLINSLTSSLIANSQDAVVTKEE